MADCCSLPLRSNLCHCARCHETFSHLSLFDKHQEIRYNTPQPVSCITPESLGLLRDTKGVWRSREGLLGLTEKVARMATARAVKARSANV